ncbi:MAG: ABC transporter ATP-binding protein [Lachnospiraceae bacterium]
MGIKLKVENLCFSYYGLKGETETIKNLSFEVNEGEFVALVGPSGCGKTTLLSCLAGLLTPTLGSISIDGKDLSKSDVRIGYMHQKDLLFDWRDNHKNIALSIEINPFEKDIRTNKISELLETYDLKGFEHGYPSGLSGGMRQRVALIRTLISNPDILLLDEPFSALDFQTRLEVSDDIYRIIRKENKTALLITHDIEEAISMADKILILSKRPTRIIDEIEINLTINSRTPFTARDAPEFTGYFHHIYKELKNGEKI